MRVCEVTSKELRWAAGELMRKEVAAHTNVVPSCVFQYIVNATKSNWKTRFPWSRILIHEQTFAVPPKKRIKYCCCSSDNDSGSTAAAVVRGVILCEPDGVTKTLEIRFIADVVGPLLDAAKQYCISQGYASMFLWCGEWFDASCFVEFGFVPQRRQQNWARSSHYSVLYSFKILNVVE